MRTKPEYMFDVYICITSIYLSIYLYLANYVLIKQKQVLYTHIFADPHGDNKQWMDIQIYKCAAFEMDGNR